ncbi:MAG: hypothetical protein ACOC2H_07255 [Spirochaetota bacterium]
MSLVKRAEKAYGKASTVHFLPIIIKIPYRILKTNAYSQLAAILTIILDSDVHRTTGDASFSFRHTKTSGNASAVIWVGIETGRVYGRRIDHHSIQGLLKNS